MMNQQECYDWVVREERKLFSKFREVSIIGDKRTTYTFFAPSYYFDPRRPLITPEIVNDLKEGKRLLSVGCGPAYLERFLVRAGKISAGGIELADIDPHYRRKEFRMHVFDMHKSWPNLEERFDYVIFPNSLFTYDLPTEESEIERDTRITYNLLVEGFKALKPMGRIGIKMPMDEQVFQKVKDRIGKEFPQKRGERLNQLNAETPIPE